MVGKREIGRSLGDSGADVLMTEELLDLSSNPLPVVRQAAVPRSEARLAANRVQAPSFKRLESSTAESEATVDAYSGSSEDKTGLSYCAGSPDEASE